MKPLLIILTAIIATESTPAEAREIVQADTYMVYSGATVYGKLVFSDPTGREGEILCDNTQTSVPIFELVRHQGTQVVHTTTDREINKTYSYVIPASGHFYGRWKCIQEDGNLSPWVSTLTQQDPWWWFAWPAPPGTGTIGD